MALLLDLPPATRAELARRWGCGDTTGELYIAMTDGARLADRIGSHAALANVLRAGPLNLDDLLAHLPLSRERAADEVAELGRLGVVVRLGPGGKPRPAAPPFGRERLALPLDIAAALNAQSGSRSQPWRRR